ncbi:MAG: hypothetical protein M1324_03960 [Patescibacteria group bacterium]|nr:hypothetical protein [Patescibacteria group bacterium]
MKRVVAVFFEGTGNGVRVRRSFIVASETINKLLDRATANRCSLTTSGLMADPNDPGCYPVRDGKPIEGTANIEDAISLGPVTIKYKSTVCLLTAME